MTSLWGQRASRIDSHRDCGQQGYLHNHERM